MRGKKFIVPISIFMMIDGAANLIMLLVSGAIARYLSLIASEMKLLSGTSAFSAIAPIIFAFLIMILSPILYILIGVYGFKASRSPKEGKPAITLSVIYMILKIVSMITRPGVASAQGGSLVFDALLLILVCSGVIALQRQGMESPLHFSTPKPNRPADGKAFEFIKTDQSGAFSRNEPVDAPEEAFDPYFEEQPDTTSTEETDGCSEMQPEAPVVKKRRSFFQRSRDFLAEKKAESYTTSDSNPFSNLDDNVQSWSGGEDAWDRKSVDDEEYLRHLDQKEKELERRLNQNN